VRNISAELAVVLMCSLGAASCFHGDQKADPAPYMELWFSFDRETVNAAEGEGRIILLCCNGRAIIRDTSGALAADIRVERVRTDCSVRRPEGIYFPAYVSSRKQYGVKRIDFKGSVRDVAATTNDQEDDYFDRNKVMYDLGQEMLIATQRNDTFLFHPGSDQLEFVDLFIRKKEASTWRKNLDAVRRLDDAIRNNMLASASVRARSMFWALYSPHKEGRQSIDKELHFLDWHRHQPVLFLGEDGRSAWLSLHPGGTWEVSNQDYLILKCDLAAERITSWSLAQIGFTHNLSSWIVWENTLFLSEGALFRTGAFYPNSARYDGSRLHYYDYSAQQWSSVKGEGDWWGRSGGVVWLYPASMGGENALFAGRLNCVGVVKRKKN